ncbi:MAG: hypothetical protein LBH32_08270 [Dysgonamonadaceae bacterium]|jgi:alpha-glucosidase|nr:hypothetical protein [Dysgonamonadaceae bacterium]
MSINEEKFLWWKHGVIYHIFPHSFNDTDGDGAGDIEGIIQKLDYLSDLGVDAIWLSPVYESPWIDAGYDISDYKSINSIYGDMNAFKRLLDMAHKKNIRIIMDLVLNHTSDRHKWFQESRSSKNSPKREWYIWRSPSKKGKRPNNWQTNYWQSAWTFDALTGEYYYHSFFKEQPDLNWRNPELENEMFETVRFWLDTGVDGFRLDVINMIFKDENLRNNPITHFFSDRHVYNRNQPELYDFLKKFRALLDKYPDKVSVGEIYTLPPGNPKLTASFMGDGKNMLHLTFDFSLIFSRWNASKYRKIINNFYQAIPNGGHPCFVMSNHDLGRSVKRWIFAFNRYEKAKIHAILLLTLKGTPFIYYGDEIGMENVIIPKNRIRDMYGKLFFPFYRGRDRSRTPMQWNDLINAGFSAVEPWLPVHRNYRTVNVASESADSNSILNLYKNLIRLRKTHKALQSGEIEFTDFAEKGIISYIRTYEDTKIKVILNFTGKHRKIKSFNLKYGEILLSTHAQNREISGNTDILNPFEGILVKLTEN